MPSPQANAPARLPRPPRRTRRAFTLVELLVVISVIAILAALLFPAIRAMRRSSNVQVTRSLLAQVCLAAEQYREAREQYPAGASLGGAKLVAELGTLISVKSTFLLDLCTVDSQGDMSVGPDGKPDTVVDAWGRPFIYTRYLSFALQRAPKPGDATNEGRQPVHNIRTFDLFSCGAFAGNDPTLGTNDWTAYQTAALANDHHRYNLDGRTVEGQANKFIGNW